MNNASISASIHSWAISLHSNEVQLIGIVIGAITTILTASVAVWIAFRQLKKQFEHKIIYEGWSDFQTKLFAFSNAITDFSSTIQWLQYFVTSQDNPLVNGGNKNKYRLDKWNEIVNSYSILQKCYIEFLRSFETHEVIFTPLSRMMKTFQEQNREKVDDTNVKFIEKVFPEMYGSKKTYSEKELKDIINKYWQDMTDVQIYLDDFRIELQNLTVGKVLNKKVAGRKKLSKEHKKLTRSGLK